jgi:sugar lactone lactonase YvrE
MIDRWVGMLSLVLAVVLLVADTPAHLSASQASRSVGLAPPAIPTEQTHPGRWEIFAGAHDEPGELAARSGVGIDATGIAYIGDPVNKRIQKLTPDGAPVGSFPIWPGYVGYVGPIRGIVVAPGGDIVVLFVSPLARDGPEPYYLIRYAPSGQPLGQFGQAGTGPHSLEQARQFGGPDRPGGFDVAPDGTVWVADTAHHRLVAYARDGRLVRTIGSQGTQPGQFKSPGGVGVGPDGTLYVADTGNNRIQILAPSGPVLGVWDNAGPDAEQLAAPSGIRVGRDGSVFVSRTSSGSSSYRFQRFGPNQTLLAGAWLSSVGSFAVGPDGNVLMIGGYSSEPGVRRFNANLEEYDPLMGVVAPAEAPSRLMAPRSVAFDAQDNVYVTDAKQAAVYVYAPDGTLLYRWGTRGDDFGQVRSPSAIAIAPDGTIYLADYDLDRIYKLSREWQLLDVWGGSGSGPGRLTRPSDLVLDAAGNLYVADLSNSRVQKFGPGGEVLAILSGPRLRSDSSVGLSVAVDSLGRIYTNSDGHSMIRLLPDGTFDRELASSERNHLGGLTLDASGNVWVVEIEAGKLWELDQAGQAVAVWGSGSQPGIGPTGSGPTFTNPNSVSVDRLGRIYVTDDRARIWRFTPEGMP